MVPREMERGRKPMPAAADDDDVVARLRLGLTPGGPPAAMAAQSLESEAKTGITRHGRGGFRRRGADAYRPYPDLQRASPRHFRPIASCAEPPNFV